MDPFHSPTSPLPEPPTAAAQRIGAGQIAAFFASLLLAFALGALGNAISERRDGAPLAAQEPPPFTGLAAPDPPDDEPATPIDYPQLPPVDEAHRDPSLVEFRERLRDAVARRDRDALLACLSPDITLIPGEPWPDDPRGRRAFEELYEPADPESPVWRELATILALGGTFAEPLEGFPPRFTAPYSYHRWPAAPPMLDEWTSSVVVGEDVPVHAETSPLAPVVARLSHAIVHTGNWDPGFPGVQKHAPEDWVPVTLPDGRKGYVARPYVASLRGGLLSFEKVDGEWRIGYFGGMGC